LPITQFFIPQTVETLADPLENGRSRLPDVGGMDSSDLIHAWF
jgi:hypothetical protein